MLSIDRNVILMDEKIESSGQKMDIRIPLKCSKCSGGLHLKIPPKIVKLYSLETGDEIHVQMKHVLYGNIREIPKI